MAKSRINSSGLPSQRQLRMGELVRKELSDVLVRREVHDPVLSDAIVTIPEVRLTADLRLATVMIMPLGGINAERVVEALNNCRKYLRGRISQRFTMKFVPDLKFVLDTRFDDDDKMDALFLKPEVARDLQADEEQTTNENNIHED